jgi:E3 ubiquitin-protein ligase RNF146
MAAQESAPKHNVIIVINNTAGSGPAAKVVAANALSQAAASLKGLSDALIGMTGQAATPVVKAVASRPRGRPKTNPPPVADSSGNVDIVPLPRGKKKAATDDIAVVAPKKHVIDLDGPHAMPMARANKKTKATNVASQKTFGKKVPPLIMDVDGLQLMPMAPTAKVLKGNKKARPNKNTKVTKVAAKKIAVKNVAAATSGPPIIVDVDGSQSMSVVSPAKAGGKKVATPVPPLIIDLDGPHAMPLARANKKTKVTNVASQKTVGKKVPRAPFIIRYVAGLQSMPVAPTAKEPMGSKKKTKVAIDVDESVVSPAKAGTAAAMGQATQKAANDDVKIGTKAADDDDDDDPCPVCFDTPLHPIKLPCNHTYCFLCAKGLSETVLMGGGACALCRQPISRDFFRHPQMNRPSCSPFVGGQIENECWFYEGKNGWWKFDERNNEDIEDMYSKGVPKADLLICGNMYVIDYQNYLQYRKDGCGRVRRIKRDNPSVSVKGVAGLIQLQ